MINLMFISHKIMYYFVPDTDAYIFSKRRNLLISYIRWLRELRKTMRRQIMFIFTWINKHKQKILIYSNISNEIK